VSLPNEVGLGMSGPGWWQRPLKIKSCGARW
jgi:hypothetical protein